MYKKIKEKYELEEKQNKKEDQSSSRVFISNSGELKNFCIEIFKPLHILIIVKTVRFVLGRVFIFARVDCVIPDIVQSLFILIFLS